MAVQIPQTKRAFFRASNSDTPQSCGPGNFTFARECLNKVEVNTEDAYNVNNATFTAPVDGWYFVGGFLQLTNIDDGARLIVSLFKGSSYRIDISRTISGGSSFIGLSGHTLVNMNAGETLRMALFHDSAGGKAMNVTTENACFFEGWLEAPR